MPFLKVSERLAIKRGKCTSCAIYFAYTGKKCLIAPQIIQTIYCTPGADDSVYIGKNEKFT